jgi:UPF0755 protein
MRRTAVRGTIFAAVLLTALAILVGFIGYERYGRPGPLGAPVVLIIEKGSGVARIADQLESAGVIRNALLFRVGVRLEGRESALKAGEYAFPARISMRAVAALLASGRTVRRRLTIAEGLTTRQALAVVAATDGLIGTISRPVKEGGLLPETYFFSYGDSREGLVARMEQAMRDMLTGIWAKRSEGLSVRSRKEALVLASLIEKETGKPEERARISAVFHNRLKRGMRLQTDPTVVYAISGGDGPIDRPLTRGDLSITSPYNTYLKAGLPPGPIANPGVASLVAAVNPAPVEDLYFVADGNGGHLFARTLEEHNRNVARWRQMQRERRMQGAR